MNRQVLWQADSESVGEERRGQTLLESIPVYTHLQEASSLLWVRLDLFKEHLLF